MDDGTPDWPHEWFASLRWIGEAYAATLAGFIVVVWLHREPVGSHKDPAGSPPEFATAD